MLSTHTRLTMLRRSFSTASVLRSNIGSAPIIYPPTLTMEPHPTELKLTGPKGSTSVHLHPFVKLKHDDQNRLCVSVEDPGLKIQRSMWGTTRTLIANAIKGLTDGYVVPLKLVGVGYRAALEADPSGKGERLNMKLGFAHPVYVRVPEGIKAEVPLPTRIVLRGTSKHQLGQFAAEIRQWRKPEPYKGKGIFVGDETIRLKTVKKK